MKYISYVNGPEYIKYNTKEKDTKEETQPLLYRALVYTLVNDNTGVYNDLPLRTIEVYGTGIVDFDDLWDKEIFKLFIDAKTGDKFCTIPHELTFGDGCIGITNFFGDVRDTELLYECYNRTIPNIENINVSDNVDSIEIAQTPHYPNWKFNSLSQKSFEDLVAINPNFINWKQEI